MPRTLGVGPAGQASAGFDYEVKPCRGRRVQEARQPALGPEDLKWREWKLTSAQAQLVEAEEGLYGGRIALL